MQRRLGLTGLTLILASAACGSAEGDIDTIHGNDAALTGTWATSTRTLLQTCWPQTSSVDVSVVPGNSLQLEVSSGKLSFGTPHGPTTVFEGQEESWINVTSVEAPECSVEITTRLTVVGLTAGNLSALLDQDLQSTGSCPDLEAPSCQIRTTIYGARQQ